MLQKFRLDWNYNSNAIEGNSLTLGETRSLLLHGLTAAGKPMRDHLDIKGHNEAVLWLEDFVRDERPLTEQFIRGMHQVLLGEPYEVQAQTPDGQPTRKMIQPGQYKRQPNNVLTSTGEIFYFASPEETPGRMTDLVDWYRQEAKNSALHPVALATEFHYRFVRIHPFDDGNGRMSRLLMNLILLRHGYSITVIKAADRNRYLAALAEADAGEPESFLRFIIENVEASLRLMIRAAKGESIDESDDLDKKLALLRKQLDKNSNLVKKWGPEEQATIYDDLLKNWFDNLIEETKRFDNLFGRKEFYGAVFFGLKHLESTQLTILFGLVKEFISSTLKKGVQLSSGISINISWKELIKSDLSLNVVLAIDFLFETDKLVVFSRILNDIPPCKNDSQLQISTLAQGEITAKTTFSYNSYNSALIYNFNHQLANKVYDFIAAKVAEADTPPA